MATFTGTNGNDTLTGSTNLGDTLTGSIGNDTFVFGMAGAGHTDVVTDFGSMYFRATISGSQETPANNSPFTGTATSVLRKGYQAYSFTATMGMDLGGRTAATNDDVTASHFHAGPAGVAAGVVFGYFGAPNNETSGNTVIDASTGTVSGVWNTNEGNNTTLTAQILNILTNRLYINFHSAAFPGGEIRGQMLAQDSGGDRIDIRATGITDWAGLQAALSEVNGSAQISTTTAGGQTYTLVLQDVPLSSLTAADFIFAGRAGPSFTLAQLQTAYMNTHAGRAAGAEQNAVFANLVSGSSISSADSVLRAVVDMADNDAAVAVTSYAFFTGLTPSQLGLTYLVNSSLNAGDLNDPAYAQFNLSNRAINMAENLAVTGEGAARFQAAYGAMTFSGAVDAVYDAIVGNAQATAAGINLTTALNDIKGRQAAFQAIVTATLPATVNQDIALKAVMAGYILGEAIKADVGLYARASDNFLVDLTDGGAAFGVNLVGVYGSGPVPVGV